MNIPTNQDFATEVKTDRLRLLWRVTLFVAIISCWIILNIAMLQRSEISRMVIPIAVLIVGMLATRFFLNRGVYSTAAWTYVIVGVAALGLGLIFADDVLVRVLPFAFPILIFIVGLLLPPSNTLLTSLVTAGVIFLGPLLGQHDLNELLLILIASIGLTFVGAVVAAQVAGDLYQIADWALSNYERERRVAGELFESQTALERSLARSTALGERLQETNVELDAARTSAEDAKHFRGQFLANMSHELRTPLNAIIGFSETMLKFPAMYDGVKLPNAYEADLQQIYSSGRQLLTLINDILDLAKVDAGKLEVRLERVDLQRVISDVTSVAAGLVGSKPVRLETDMPDYLPAVWADEARVRQVLFNLYSNAAKFTDHGTIKLSVGVFPEGVRIGITDSGIGISQENLEIIFEEFKQAETGARDPRSGAGLGLAISRQLMTLMGGRVWAESQIGKGSTFYVMLQPYQEVTTMPEPEMVKERN
jgi:signal transduction histidine kinase